MLATCIILSVLFTVAFAVRNSFQFKEMTFRVLYEKDKAHMANRNWHIFQAGVQLVFFILVYLYSDNEWIAVMCATIFWILFDTLVNIIGLDRGIFYVGQTAFIDRLYQRLPYPALFMVLSKLIILGGAIFLYLKDLRIELLHY